jgi:hypothetical protein
MIANDLRKVRSIPFVSVSELETVETSATPSSSPALNPPRLQIALNVIVPLLRQSVQQHMPECAFRDYYLWGLDPTNSYHDDWVSLIGLKKIVQFTLETIATPFPDAQIAQFTQYAAPMILYLNFEVVSDNLEFGLNDRGEGDPTYYLRAHLIREFCHAMCARLAGDLHSAAELLAHEEEVARRISSLHQSLNPEKHARIADAYLRLYPNVAPEALENGLLPQLIMNIETCRDLTRSAQDFQANTLIHKALYRRYRSAERVFRDPNLDLSRVVSYGAYTILIIPVLAYYLEMSANAFGMSDRWRVALDNGDLSRTLYYCSVLVRLLNDLGTSVITQSPEALAALINDLRHQARYQQGAGNIRSFLRRQASNHQQRNLLARIAKDVETGEFNIALYNLSHVNPLDSALVIFGEQLGKLNQIYHRTYVDFEAQLAKLSTVMGSTHMSTMIRRVVEFHVEMYGNDYRKVHGDYAV